MKKIVSKECIQKIKSSFNIGDYIGKHTNLDYQGGKLVGRSPLVDDDDECSLSVDIQKGRFYCKASKKSGDIIAYEQAYSGTKFVETVEYLAMLRGVELEYVEPKRGSFARPMKRYAA